MTEKIPTYDPTDSESDFPFDWMGYYQGENAGVSAGRPVTVGHSIQDTSWPHPKALEDVPDKTA